MDMMEAMDARRSVRIYSERAVCETDAAPLLGRMEDFNRENGMTMEWVMDGSAAFESFRRTYGRFRNVRSLISIKGRKDDPGLKEKAGYYGELLALQAVASGFVTCFVGGTYDRSRIRVLEDEEPVMVMTFGYPVNREPFSHRFLNGLKGNASDIGRYVTADGELPSWAAAGIRAALKAPSAMNRRPARFRFADGELTAYVEREEGFNMVDLGAAKANFEVAAGGRFARGNHAPFVKD